MKKHVFLIGLVLASFYINVNAQSLRVQNKEAIEILQDENARLLAANEELNTQLISNDQRLAEIKVNVDSLIQGGKENLKIPTTVEEAKGLHVYIMSFVMFIVVGVFGDKLPSWLTPFIQSVIVGIIIALIAYFGSNGAFTINEAVQFFLAISGGSNIIHQVKKPQRVIAANA
ncbi:MAG: hypothetical protein AAFZ15_17375 [Bacteroidota bacterium]